MKHSGLIQKHSCYQCSSSFTRKDSLERHVKIQHEGFRLKCEFCEHTSTQKGHLKVHINEVHMKIKQLNEECTLCDFKPRDLYHLKLHINSVHLKLKSKCPHCDFETSHLRAHIRVAHNRDKIRKYQCNLCEYSHINKTQMDIHRNGVHLGINLNCQFCDFKSASKYALKAHVKIKHMSKTESKLYQCPECPKVFKSASTLNRHFKPKHEGFKYDCKICDYNASQKIDLQRHEERKHFPKLESCSICSKQIVALDMKHHVKNVHSDSNQLFNCKHCDYQSRTKRLLQRHTSIHTRNVLQCDICTFSTKYYRTLQMHRSRVHKNY